MEKQERNWRCRRCGDSKTGRRRVALLLGLSMTTKDGRDED